MSKAAAMLFALIACSVAGAADETALCVLCHGTNANGNASIRAPKLAGLGRSYLLRQLQAFRSGARGTHARDVNGSEMRTIALSLPDRELEKVVDGIVGMKAEPPEVMIQGDVARGRSLYAACSACHGERGEGNEALNAPALARGNDWYWVTQLHNYRAGLRGADPLDTVGAPMRAAAASLPDERGVSDVVAYINTLR